MKTPRILLALGACLALGSADWAHAQQGVNRVADTYQTGLDALEAGNAELARQCFEAVLRQQPNHANARYQLLNLRNRGPELAAKARRGKLAKIKIPKVDYQESSVEEALDALSAMIDQQTKGEFAANFIIQDPAGTLAKERITMTLGGVPASVVLDYILNLSGATARFDEHAIVIKPEGGGGAGKAPPAKAPGDAGKDPFAR